MVRILFAVQYNTRPDGKGASMIVKNKGKNINIFFCISSCGAGFNFCCSHIVNPIKIGRAPIIIKEGGSHGIKPNKLNIEVGSFYDKYFIKQKKV